MVIEHLVRADSYPRELASYQMLFRLSSYPSNADHSIEPPRPDSLHAVMVAENASTWIRVTAVRPPIDQCSHLSPRMAACTVPSHSLGPT
jgi:hypothetical protein